MSLGKGPVTLIAKKFIPEDIPKVSVQGNITLTNQDGETLTCENKSIPIALVLADGECSDRGPVTHFNPVILKIEGNEESIDLDIAIVAHDIILGKS